MSGPAGDDPFARGAALVPFPEVTLEASGKQARDFLHRMLSQDVKGQADGEVRSAFLLTREGRPVALFLMWSTEGRLLLSCDARAAPAARATLERFVIADDVSFGDPAVAHALLVGPAAPEALSAAGVAPPPPGRIARGALGGHAALVARRDVGALPAFRVLVPAAGAASALDALLRMPSVVAAGEEALDALRVEQGVPAWGAEIDGRALPTETGPLDALSKTKGCYPGQEPVVMSMHRGHPATRLCRLTIEGAAVPARDALLLEGDRRAGRITTAVATAAGVRALALVRFDVAKEGALLGLEGGPSVTVTQVLV